MSKNVLSIPAGVPFAKTLAAQLLAETAGAPESLAHYKILLPTRRACRTLQDTFLNLTDGKPLLLPRLLTLGQVDEEELALSIAGHSGMDNMLALPPALPPLKRQMLLAKLITALPNQGSEPKTMPQAFALAGALGRLMDKIYTENLELEALADLVPEEFSEHWQITLTFLQILSNNWPAILKEQGGIDAADRRNRLTLALANHWRDHPPQGHIIAAGSTGSIPATATLLDTIANMPQGRVILPGLDRHIDNESWDALEESHPQYGLNQLLHRMAVDRNDVTDMAQSNAPRAYLASELMRPAALSHHWMELNNGIFKNALSNMSLLTCKNEQEEATAIAISLRELLEQPNKTATLITPDRNLARRVSAICKRWGIDVDDSAGTPLHKTQIGTFLRLILEVALSDFAPVPFLTLLKHPLCCAAMNRNEYLGGVADLEKYALRGTRKGSGAESLKNRLIESESRTKTQFTDAHAALQKVTDTLERVTNSSKSLEPLGFKEIITIHISAAEALSTRNSDEGGEYIWSLEAGESASKLLSELIEHSVSFPSLSLANYADIIDIIMGSQTVRPAFGTHPRIHILGQIEARLIDSDLIILAGLNEGTWPPAPPSDPWMSRPMRRDFGLPSHERSIGLAAHDFVQAFCAPDILITRPKQTTAGPAVPARWLQRLDTVLEATALKPALDNAQHLLTWAQSLDHIAETKATTRPEPCPPVSVRPTQLSVTGIDTWLKDPYSIYAKHILKLKKLDPLEMESDAAIRGTLIHEMLENFITAHPDNLPSNGIEILDNLAQDSLKRHVNDPTLRSFWTPRISRLSQWFLINETHWRESVSSCKVEIKGKTTLPSPVGIFTLTARADRIDRFTLHATCTESAPDDTKTLETSIAGAIIDYKTGNNGKRTGKALREGRLPQLPLEALILAKGGFENIPAMIPTYLGYWTLTGGTPAGKLIEVSTDNEKDDLPALITQTEEGLKNLIATFADESTPYIALPNARNLPEFNDYEHLSRFREWAVAHDGSNSTAEEAA